MVDKFLALLDRIGQRRAMWCVPETAVPIVPEPSVSIEQGIEEYFATADGLEAMITFARIRAILIGRKLVRKERSDIGKKRVGKLGLPSDVSPEIASQDEARAIVDEAIRERRAGAGDPA